jgi:LuxR family maltose regulon positive regulatory protein
LLIQIHALKALAYHAQGAADRALQSLGRALTLAEPEGYVRLFADEGAPMTDLLLESVERGAAPKYAHKLLSALGVERHEREANASKSSAALAEPLTDREMQVLRLLSTHLSSNEIADRLYISANTARFHIKNIYGKLGVHRRSDAIQRASALKLL